VPLHWQNLSWAAKKNVDIEPVVNIMDFPYLGDLVVNTQILNSQAAQKW
jgi:peptide/nickel transport system substrate-binding protein